MPGRFPTIGPPDPNDADVMRFQRAYAEHRRRVWETFNGGFQPAARPPRLGDVITGGHRARAALNAGFELTPLARVGDERRWVVSGPESERIEPCSSIFPPSSTTSPAAVTGRIATSRATRTVRSRRRSPGGAPGTPSVPVIAPSSQPILSGYARPQSSGEQLSLSGILECSDVRYHWPQPYGGTIGGIVWTMELWQETADEWPRPGDLADTEMVQILVEQMEWRARPYGPNRWVLVTTREAIRSSGASMRSRSGTANSGRSSTRRVGRLSRSRDSSRESDAPTTRQLTLPFSELMDPLHEWVYEWLTYPLVTPVEYPPMEDQSS